MTATAPEIPKKDVPYYVKALAMAIPAVMLGLQISGWIFFLPGALRGHADFRQLYAAAHMVRSRHRFELYDYNAQKRFQDALVSREAVVLPFIRPAYSALLFVPLSLLPYRVAYFLFLAINALLLAACYRLIRARVTNLATVWDLLPLAMLISFLPTGAAMMQGQDSILLLFLLISAMVQLQNGSEVSAGLLVGAALFKFQVIIPMVFLFLCWKRWRFFGGFVLSASAAVAMSIWIGGLEQSKAFAHMLFSLGTNVGITSQLYYPVSLKLMMNLHALTYGLLAGHYSTSVITIITVVGSASLLLWVALCGSHLSAHMQFVVAVGAALLVSFYLFIHDLVILEIPLLVMLDSTILDIGRRDWRAWIVPTLATLLFLAPTLFLAQAFLVAIPLAMFVSLMLQPDLVNQHRVNLGAA